MTPVATPTAPLGSGSFTSPARAESSLTTPVGRAFARRATSLAPRIVVLGGGRDRDDPAWGADQPSPLALERLRYAARLARASGLPLLTSGGLHFGEPPSEAKIMADTLKRDFGVDVRWQEEESRTTWENATFSAKLLQPAGVRRVLLVTQASHMPRARWCFERAGFEAAYVSGASIAYTRLGRPDIGLVSFSELTDIVAAIRERVSIPLIVRRSSR